MPYLDRQSVGILQGSAKVLKGRKQNLLKDRQEGKQWQIIGGSSLFCSFLVDQEKAANSGKKKGVVLDQALRKSQAQLDMYPIF